MKRILNCALAVTALAIAHASRAQPPDPLRAMFDSNQLFDLRDAVERTHVLLPSVDFQVGGREVTLKPAHVFLTHGLSEWAAGNVGNDLLHQAHTITLDFHAMTLRLE
jgi:hypothetical protein